jgi:predicted DNA-binding protein
MTATLHIELQQEEWERLEQAAQEHGFESPTAYVRSLVDEAIEEEWEEEEDVDVAAALREALRDVREGRVHPARDFRKLLQEMKDE